jgi:hypothetical protein
MRTIAHIGKESNQLEDIEVGLVEDLEKVQSEYDNHYTRAFVPLVLPMLRRLAVRETARRTGLSVGGVSAVLSGAAKPRNTTMKKYERAAAIHARELLGHQGVVPTGNQIDQIVQALTVVPTI